MGKMRPTTPRAERAPSNVLAARDESAGVGFLSGAEAASFAVRIFPAAFAPAVLEARAVLPPLVAPVPLGEPDLLGTPEALGDLAPLGDPDPLGVRPVLEAALASFRVAPLLLLGGLLCAMLALFRMLGKVIVPRVV